MDFVAHLGDVFCLFCICSDLVARTLIQVPVRDPYHGRGPCPPLSQAMFILLASGARFLQTRGLFGGTTQTLPGKDSAARNAILPQEFWNRRFPNSLFTALCGGASRSSACGSRPLRSQLCATAEGLDRGEGCGSTPQLLGPCRRMQGGATGRLRPATAQTAGWPRLPTHTLDPLGG